MNLNSPLFDRIRVKPAEDVSAKPQERGCDHPGCGLKGEFRAPKGRAQEGQYYWFCLEHVRAYNASYNYFAGMGDEAIADYQKDALTGHRPTWKMGSKTAASRKQGQTQAEPDYVDPLDLFGLGGVDPRRKQTPDDARPALNGAARKAFEALGIEPGLSKAEVKARYKDLVKRFHPDTNGGDRSLEERLQEVIRAYNTLKSFNLA